MLLKHFLNLKKELFYFFPPEKVERKRCFQALAYYHMMLHIKIGLPHMVWAGDWSRGPSEVPVNLNYPMIVSYNHIYLLDDYQ